MSMNDYVFMKIGSIVEKFMKSFEDTCLLVYLIYVYFEFSKNMRAFIKDGRNNLETLAEIWGHVFRRGRSASRGGREWDRSARAPERHGRAGREAARPPAARPLDSTQ